MTLRFLFSSFIVLVLCSTAFSLNKAKDCKCRISTENRIVGGHVAPNENYPWQASLGQLGLKRDKPMNDQTKMETHYCGAAILNEEWILTAAHCVVDFNTWSSPRDPEQIAVGVGHNHDIIAMFNEGRIIAKKILVKDGYFSMSPSSPNDIALIQLSSPLDLNRTVAPACIQRTRIDPYENKLVATGWGSINRMSVNVVNHLWSGYEPSRYLKEADFDDTTASTAVCKNRDDLICISPSEGEEKSSCKGDSGGPLHYTINGKTFIVGVTSFGPSRVVPPLKYETCIGTAAFTRLSSHVNWLESVVGDNMCLFD